MPNFVVIGGGHNGLAAAFYLAKAGLKPLVLEARDQVGGGAVTGEIHPGFHGPLLSHELLLHARVARDMDLPRHGLQVLTPAARVCALSPDGAPLVLHDGARASVESIRSVDRAAADAYAGYRQAIDRVAAVVATLLEAAPPDIDAPGAGDLWSLLKAGRRFRALGRRDEYRLLRWLPMTVADLVEEWFAHDLLRAAIAARGVSGTMLGPRSAGSTLVLLLREAHARLAGSPSLQVRGGPGALTRAMAAATAAAGAEIRTSAPVERILVRDERVTGVVAGGKEIPASAVVSAVDPRSTFLRLIDPVDLVMPDFVARVRNYRAAGTIAKVNLALSALPAFRGVTSREAISGRIHIGPDLDYLERAFDHVKYGEHSLAPWLDVTIPSIMDPQLAPAGGHVASVYVHCAPYALRGDWEASRPALLASAMRVLETYAPGIGKLVVHAQTLTPRDLEAGYGPSGGHIFHGELAPDQLFTMRPLLGLGKYTSPIAGLYLCGGGTHPGGFLTGASGRLAAAEILRRRAI